MKSTWMWKPKEKIKRCYWKNSKVNGANYRTNCRTLADSDWFFSAHLIFSTLYEVCRDVLWVPFNDPRQLCDIIHDFEEKNLKLIYKYQQSQEELEDIKVRSSSFGVQRIASIDTSQKAKS